MKAPFYEDRDGTTQGALGVFLLDAAGNPIASGASAATATPAQRAASTSAVTLLAANATRRGATVYYDGAAILYLLEGSGTPSSTSFTTKLGAGYFTQYDAPAGFVGALKASGRARSGRRP